MSRKYSGERVARYGRRYGDSGHQVGGLARIATEIAAIISLAGAWSQIAPVVFMSGVNFRLMPVLPKTIPFTLNPAFLAILDPGDNYLPTQVILANCGIWTILLLIGMIGPYLLVRKLLWWHAVFPLASMVIALVIGWALSPSASSAVIAFSVVVFAIYTLWYVAAPFWVQLRSEIRFGDGILRAVAGAVIIATMFNAVIVIPFAAGLFHGRWIVGDGTWDGMGIYRIIMKDKGSIMNDALVRVIFTTEHGLYVQLEPGLPHPKFGLDRPTTQAVDEHNDKVRFNIMRSPIMVRRDEIEDIVLLPPMSLWDATTKALVEGMQRRLGVEFRPDAEFPATVPGGFTQGWSGVRATTQPSHGGSNTAAP